MIVNKNFIYVHDLPKLIKTEYIGKGRLDPKKIRQEVINYVKSILLTHCHEGDEFDDQFSYFFCHVLVDHNDVVHLTNDEDFYSELLLRGYFVPETQYDGNLKVVDYKNNLYLYMSYKGVEMGTLPNKEERERIGGLWIEPIKEKGLTRIYEDYTAKVSSIKKLYLKKVTEI
jgi:hypothetical protein